VIRELRYVGSVLLLLGVWLVPMCVSVADDAETATADPRQLIEEHLERGRALLQQGDAVAAQAAFAAILQIDATQPDALRLMTKAQQQREAQQAKVERDRARLRSRAQELAVQFAKEKAKERGRQDAQGRQQVARAREQQLKYLYTTGLTFYQQGRYQAAIETFQQMVLLDPTHALVRAAARLIAQAETKQAEARARASATLSPGGPVKVDELEQQLAAKRIELETTLKYARVAMKERNYDLAVQFLQRVLVQDPRNRPAQQLLDQAQTAKLNDEEDRLKHAVALDEHKMANAVVKAQILPETKPVQLVAPPVTQGPPASMAAKLQQPISLNFDDVALKDVLEFLGDAASVSIIPSPQLDLKTRRISLKVTDLPLEQAIKYLAKSQSLAYRIERDAILIATQEEFSNEPMETRVFFLQSGLGPFALKAAAVEPNTMPAMESLKQLVEQSVPQPSGSKLVIDERSGALVTTNTADNLRLVEQLLSQLDVTPVQVLIEARFLEVNMTEFEHLAVESVLTGDASLTKTGARDKTTRGPGHQIASGGGFKFPTLAREGEGLNLTLQGVLTGTQFESVLHLLEETKKTKTLSAPRVTALNNQSALIRVVDEFRYPTQYEVTRVQFDINGDGDFDDAGETEFVNVPKDIKKRDVGILLHVTPSVGKDRKTITLVLAPEVSTFSQFRDLGGGTTVPEFTSSQLTTSVVIEDGQTVVLGGLMKDTTDQTVTKVPVLGDLPVVGNLFRQKSTSSSRKNLLIFITARILAPRGETT